MKLISESLDEFLGNIPADVEIAFNKYFLYNSPKDPTNYRHRVKSRLFNKFKKLFYKM